LGANDIRGAPAIPEERLNNSSGAVKTTAHYNGWREKQMKWVTRKRVHVNRAATALRRLARIVHGADFPHEARCTLI